MRKGFTLIELLVVIAIIGILSGIVLVSLGGARAKARDAVRESDIGHIATAMEMDYSDNEKYLVTTVDGNNRLTITKIGTYLDPLPNDPGGGKVANCNDVKGAAYKAYDNSGDTTQYCIWACLEGGEFFAASEKGTKKFTATEGAPADLNCW